MQLKEVVAKYNNVDLFLANLFVEIQNLVEKNPEFVYTTIKYGSCNYNGPANDGEIIVGPECSGCLIGQALQTMGWDDTDELEYFGNVIELLNEFGGIDGQLFTNPLLNKIRMIQTKQDDGHSWKSCI